MNELARILEQGWAEEPEPVGRVEERQQREQEKEKKILFLGKKEITPRSDVVLFENGEFFVELNGSGAIIRARYEKEYLKIRGRRSSKRYTKFTRAPNPVLIPLAVTRENPEKWLNDQYVSNAKRNMQGHFIKKIWEHRHEFMPMLCMG